VKVLWEGTGPRVAAGEVIVANVDIKVWQGSRQYLNTWDDRQPTTLVFDGKHVSGAWQQALEGHRAGSRILLVAPATQGFGPAGMAPTGVRPSDTLAEVFDIIGGYQPVASSAEPIVRPGRGAAPSDVTVQMLVRGTGAPIRAGSTFVTDYVAARWEDGVIVDSSYRRGGPTGFVLDARSVPPGWVQALAGVRVGSRVIVTVPGGLRNGQVMTPGGIGIPTGKAAVYELDVLDVV
jgi:peptidylprolyl isomerase